MSPHEAYDAHWINKALIELPMKLSTAVHTRRIEVVLHTDDMCVGRGFLGGADAMVWNAEPYEKTSIAEFNLLESGKSLECVSIDGELWRVLEDEGLVDDLVAKVQAGAGLKPTLVAIFPDAQDSGFLH